MGHGAAAAAVTVSLNQSLDVSTKITLIYGHRVVYEYRIKGSWVINLS
jgi:hypothetical protein